MLLKEEKQGKGKKITTVKGINREISMLTHERGIIQRQLKGLKYQGSSDEPVDDLISVDDFQDLLQEEEEEEEEREANDEEGEDGEEKPKTKAKKKSQKALGRGVHEDAKHVMSARKGPPSNLTTSSGAGSTIDPFDERLFNFMGRPKEATAEEKALAMEEKQLEKDQEEWEWKRRREDEEFELRKEERKAAAQKDTILMSLLAKLSEK